jgi:cytidylate kinase
MMKKLRVEKREAEKMIDKQDAERRRMTRTFFAADIDDPLRYDVTFNSTTVQMHEISHAVIEMIKHRFNPDGTSKGVV